MNFTAPRLAGQPRPAGYLPGFAMTYAHSIRRADAHW